MLNTQNYGLKKPEGTDVVDIQNFNDNADIIDAKLKEVNTSLSELTQDRIYYCGTTSGTNTYAVTNSEITAYTEGLTVRAKIGTASTGASTININGLGAKTILDSLGNAITSGGLKAGLPYQLCYNGTNFIVLGKGGGGTADASKILAPYNATVDSGQVTGTIASKAEATYNPSTVAQTIAANQYLTGIQTIAAITGTAALADVLATKTFNSANGISLTGTMANRGAVTNTIATAGGTYTIPVGYHNGSGVVTAPSLATVTASGTVTATSQILSGYSAYSDGVLYNGTATVESLGGTKFATGTSAVFISGTSNLCIDMSSCGFQPRVILLRPLSQVSYYYGSTINYVPGNQFTLLVNNVNGITLMAYPHGTNNYGYTVDIDSNNTSNWNTSAIRIISGTVNNSYAPTGTVSWIAYN